MAYINNYADFLNEAKTEYATKDSVASMRKLPKEWKEEAIKFLKEYSNKTKSGGVAGLKLHPGITKKANEKGCKIGFDMGIDKDGYYIHTHRARSKSHTKPDGITVKEMKFIESTG